MSENVAKRGYEPKFGKPVKHYIRTLLTDEQYQDLIHLSNSRDESFSETIRNCFLAVVKNAKNKGAW